jgi:hypothetical protein
MKRTTLLLTVGVSVLALLAVVVRKGGGMIVIPNRVRVVVVMVSALALAAGLLTLALLEKPAQAQAETITSTDRETISGTTPTFCPPGSGEPIFLEGTLHTVAHTTTDPTGGFFVKLQFHIQGQGEGLSSGDKYVYNNMSNFNHNSPTGADLNITHTAAFRIIRQGSDTTTDDLNARAVFHVTVNANGEVTAEFTGFEYEPCR